MRNEDRLGSMQNIDNPRDVSNLDFPTPTEFVDLPSKGKFYSAEHPLYNKETVEIKYMTAAEEDILTSKTLIKKGVAVERLLQKLIQDPKIKINELLVGDKNALVIASRISGYGSEYEILITCPSCLEQTKYQFDLSNLKTTECSDEILKETNSSITENKTILLTLPKTKWNVELKFLTGEDEKWLTLTEEQNKKHKLPERSSTDLLKRIILSINGIKDGSVLNKTIDNMPAIDSKYLRVAYKRLTPNIDLSQNFVCSSCGAEQEVQVPLTAEFFWPQR